VRSIVRLPLAGSLLVLAACSSLPQSVPRVPTSALDDTGGTRLGVAIAPGLAAHPGQSGAVLLGDGREAFAARVLLANAAERSLDVQYYIWWSDTTGHLMREALWRAAERGVRVRLLLDDNNTRGQDRTLSALDAHPGIEVRLFNPYANRGVRIGEMAGDFSRINRRMHNKSFTADNQATIVGGRNIGDEYFGANEAVEFADLDALTVGPAVQAVSRSFDDYWNSASAYPVASLTKPVGADVAATERSQAAQAVDDPKAVLYVEALRTTALIQQLLGGRLPLAWGPGWVISDDPEKVQQPPEHDKTHMLPKLEEAIGRPERSLDIVSPYFVPTGKGADALAAIAARGIKVRVLTNSLAATDVMPVHAGYSRYRERLLRAGIELYELKSRRMAAEAPDAQDKADKKHGLGRSSAASLHAKTFVADRHRVFVGSFNFDPRSVQLNTEMGLVIDSAELAGQISGGLDQRLRTDAYQVRLSPEGQLEWLDGQQVLTSEPGHPGVFKRLWLGFLQWLPIEWML
jgi:putative cardiolipin synthase